MYSSIFLSLLVYAVCYAAALSAPATADQEKTYPLPIPCRGFCTGCQDTNVIRRVSDGLYFRFSAFDGFAIATAPTLAGPWNKTLEAFPQYSQHSDTIKHWAPDVHYMPDGKLYYLYYTLYNTSEPSDGHRADIQVATSRTLESGSWTEHGSFGIPIRRPQYQRIGFNLLDDGPDALHGAFGSYSWGLFGTRLRSPLRDDPSPEPNVLVADVPVPSDPGPSGGNRTEGSFQFKHGGYYYLFNSRGNCCPGPDLPEVDVYAIHACRARSPDGPYEGRGGVSCLNGGSSRVLESHSQRQVYSPGGVRVIDDGENGVYMYYQYINATIGYGIKNFQWGHDRLLFKDGWPVLVEEKEGEEDDN